MPNYAPDAPALKPTANPTFHAAAAGDSFDNNGETLLYIKNTSGGAITVTVDAAGQTVGPDSANQFDSDVAISVAATTGERCAGPFPVGRFNDANGRVQLAFSATAGLSWAAVRAH